MELINIVLVCVYAVICVWVVYNLPILAVGIKNLRATKKILATDEVKQALPFYSVIVPAKNEEKTIGRLLESLTHLYYPQDKLEVIVVEDGSTDKTLEICQKYANQYSYI